MRRDQTGRVAWQEGFGAFSVSQSISPEVASYVLDQRKHHAKQTFDAEFLRMLKLNGISYDPKWVLG